MDKRAERGDTYLSVSLFIIYHTYVPTIYPIYLSAYRLPIYHTYYLCIHHLSIMPICLSIYVVVSHSVMSDSLQPRRLCPWSSPGKNTGVGSHSLLQRIFPTISPYVFSNTSLRPGTKPPRTYILILISNDSVAQSGSDRRAHCTS